MTKRLNETRGQTLSFAVVHSSHQAQPTQPGPESFSNGPSSPQRLNPVFGAWLMGWPLTWVSTEPSNSSALATELWRSKLQRHLSCLLAEQDSQT